MKSKNIFVLIILFATILITTTTAFSNSFNATSFVYSMPFSPSMSQAYITSTSTTNARNARRGGSLSNKCLTNEGTSGTCMSRFNCMRLGGTVKGSCTTYSGICCETNLQCDESSRLKRTIIRKPAQLPVGKCLYTIEPFSSNVCQLLVEFEILKLRVPVLTGNKLECIDYLEIGDYMLCGNNNEQHLYLPFNVASGITKISLNFKLTSGWTQSDWRLVITQLECPAVKKRINLSFLPFITDNSLQDARTIFATHSSDWDLLAPPGCNQYFHQSTGTIKSFNYDENLQTSYYLPKLNYVICIKPTPGATMIEYRVQKFSLGIQTVAQPFGLDSDCHSLVTTSGHNEDYLMIPQSVFTFMGAEIQPAYYCGTVLQGNVVSASLPFVMYFASDEKTSTVETGFNIDYHVKSILG